MLSGNDVGDVSLIDFQRHAVRLKRGNFEQHLAAFDGGAERTTQIARDHDTVDRRFQLRTGELFF